MPPNKPQEPASAAAALAAQRQRRWTDRGPMKVKQIRLPTVERFACSLKQAKAAFGGDALEWVSFGNPIRTFSFDSKARRVPSLSGPVVASVQINRRGESHLCLYPVRRDAYSNAAAEGFAESVLPRLVAWVAAKRARPATEVVGVEQVVVEWVGDNHRIHNLTFL